MKMRLVFNLGKALILLLVIWLAALIYLSGPLLRSGDSDEVWAKRLVDTQEEVGSLKRERDELNRKLRDVKSQKELEDDEHPDVPVEVKSQEVQDTVVKVHEPSKEYELTRRQTSRDVRELWNFARTQLEALAKDGSNVERKVKDILHDLNHHQAAVQVDLEHLAKEDGLEEWRKKESEDLSGLVQARLHHLQNPENCATARKLVCNLNKGCGYGCQIHHAIYCFLVAYGTERTLILKSKGWRYNKKGFEDVFLPMSDSCRSPDGESHSGWPGQELTQVVDLPIVDSVNPRPPFLPPAIPEDLADRIQRLHGDPIVWWVSQFLLYMLRPQPALQEMLENTVQTHNLQHPIVGIHVRRTDKVGTEAAFHSVEEYMKYVDEYFSKYELTQSLDKRRVYVASDDPKVLGEFRKKWPEYEFLGDQSVAKSAAVSSRYSDSSLKGVIQDIHMLSVTDYLVCTFSSQVCRIAYEIMQQYHVDASDRFKSLDDIWYYGGQDEHQQEALYEHKAQGRHSGEIDLKPGDVLGVAGNHWNGFNKGRNHRNNRVGLYPEYKTKEKLKIVKFPTYSQVKFPKQ